MVSVPRIVDRMIYFQVIIHFILLVITTKKKISLLYYSVSEGRAKDKRRDNDLWTKIRDWNVCWLPKDRGRTVEFTYKWITWQKDVSILWCVSDIDRSSYGLSGSRKDYTELRMENPDW